MLNLARNHEAYGGGIEIYLYIFLNLTSNPVPSLLKVEGNLTTITLCSKVGCEMTSCSSLFFGCYGRVVQSQTHKRCQVSLVELNHMTTLHCFDCSG